MLVTPRHVQQRFGLVITIPLDLTLWAGMMRLHFLEFTTGHCASQVTLIYSSSETESGGLVDSFMFNCLGLGCQDGSGVHG